MKRALAINKTPQPVDAAEPVTDELWRLKRVQLAVPLSHSTLYEMVARREFPSPITLVWDKNGKPRIVAWRRTEVEAWLQQRLQSQPPTRRRGSK